VNLQRGMHGLASLAVNHRVLSRATTTWSLALVCAVHLDMIFPLLKFDLGIFTKKFVECRISAAMERVGLKRLLATPLSVRGILLPSTSQRFRHQFLRPASTVPTVTQLSFWKSLIPKPLRRDHRPDPSGRKKPKSKEWNPATFFIVVFLLIGSMSINLIALKQEFYTYMRQSEVRVGLLKEVIERIQRGEEVDVERMLGAGDAEREKEWEEGRFKKPAESDRSILTICLVLKEIERDDITRNQRKQEKSRRADSTSKTKPSNTNVAQIQSRGDSSNTQADSSSTENFY
jgi:hypothetical protein